MDANSGTVELSRRLPGVLGTVADTIRVEEPARRAVIASLGALADGLIVADLGTAVAGLAALRATGVDRAEFVVAGGDRAGRRPPAEGRPLSDVIGARGRCRGRRRPGARRVRPGGRSGRRGAARLASDDGWVAVTPQGDVLGRSWARGGVRDGSTRWDMRDALEQARTAQAEAEAAVRSAQRRTAGGAAAREAVRPAAGVGPERWQDGRARQATDDERDRQWRRRVAAAQSAAAVRPGPDRRGGAAAGQATSPTSRPPLSRERRRSRPSQTWRPPTPGGTTSSPSGSTSCARPRPRPGWSCARSRSAPRPRPPRRGR